MTGVRSAFVARRRETLRAALDSGIPRRSKDALLLATWNLREFDTPGYGERSDECLQLHRGQVVVALPDRRGPGGASKI